MVSFMDILTVIMNLLLVMACVFGVIVFFNELLILGQLWVDDMWKKEIDSYKRGSNE